MHRFRAGFSAVNLTQMDMPFLRKVAIDVSPIRESRDYRLLATGEIIANLGTQAALQYQIFVTSHRPRS